MSAAFEKIIVVMFENQYRSYVRQHGFMDKLARAGASMNNYFGCFHPSQTNYIASLAAEVCNLTNDTPPAQPLPQTNLVDLLEQQGISWKAYMEGYPGETWKPEWASGNYPAADAPLDEYPDSSVELANYFRKHNAFASFKTIQDDQTRWQKIVSDQQFWRDVANQQLPQYSWFTPDIWNDGHYLYNTHIDTNPRTQLIPQIATYLEHVFLGNIETENLQGYTQFSEDTIGLNLDIDLLISNPLVAWQQSNVPAGTLIVVTFDEADFNAEGYDTNYDGPNQIYTVLLGDMIEPGTEIDTAYNHYSLIKTIEKNFGLGSLNKNDLAANYLRSLWGEQWRWSKPQSMPVADVQAIASTLVDSQLLVVTSDSSGALYARFLNQTVCSDSEFDSERDSDAALLPHLTSRSDLAMATINDRVYLLFANTQQQLCYVTYQKTQGWSAAIELSISHASAFAMSRFIDIGDANKEKLMLCWQPEVGPIQSMMFNSAEGDNSGWDDPISVGQYTDGAMAVAQLGGSLFLVYKQRNTRRMNMTSFNVAPFNDISAQTFDDQPAPDNNTSIYKWSPAEFLVGHFAGKESRRQNLYQSSGQLGLATTEGEMHLIYRDTYEDSPQFYHTCFGLTGINTAASQLSNGYGTLEQAGWTAPQVLLGTSADQGLPLCLASDGQSVTLLWQSSAGAALNSRKGGYVTED